MTLRVKTKILENFLKLHTERAVSDSNAPRGNGKYSHHLKLLICNLGGCQTDTCQIFSWFPIDSQLIQPTSCFMVVSIISWLKPGWWLNEPLFQLDLVESIMVDSTAQTFPTPPGRLSWKLTFGCSSFKVLTEHTVLSIGGFELPHIPGIVAILNGWMRCWLGETSFNMFNEIFLTSWQASAKLPLFGRYSYVT